MTAYLITDPSAALAAEASNIAQQLLPDIIAGFIGGEGILLVDAASMHVAQALWEHEDDDLRNEYRTQDLKPGWLAAIVAQHIE